MSVEQRESLREWFASFAIGATVFQIPWRSRDPLRTIGFRDLRNMVVRHYMSYCVVRWGKGKRIPSPIRWLLSARQFGEA